MLRKFEISAKISKYFFVTKHATSLFDYLFERKAGMFSESDRRTLRAQFPSDV